MDMKVFCFVKRLISSLSIPSLLSEDFSERAIESDMSETVAPDSGDTKNRLKFDGVSIVPRRNIPSTSRSRGRLGGRVGVCG